ncbi:helix-turn-helix domain-containing protein (plasmid) [Methylosinus trichosporium OB3b]|uniref:Helix-turn-helix domain-containing protein n=1 Tax=Methylosinus trichosporium (strain ATCC 35070 / NCIMB 11131 / UNIQEM 75 / OB3b) TaxID=595536 RepID=A0A2D2D7K0_METT3|nr:helix-turn-helix domain-containing protein [Methylosinus trichosporium OB3b]
MLPKVRRARIVEANGRRRARTLSCVDAAELLGMSERHFRRLRDAYEEKGAEGLIDRRRGRPAGGRRSTRSNGCWSSSAPNISTLPPSTSTRRSTARRCRGAPSSSAHTPLRRACSSYAV